MHRSNSLYHLFLLLLMISLAGCDDRNIVEPRFFDEVINEELPLYDENGEEIPRPPKKIKIEEPAWCETHPGQLILSFVLADRYDISFYVMGTAGNVIITLYEGSSGGGTHELCWGMKDYNGNRITDEEFYLLLRGGSEIDILYVDLDEI